MAVTKHDKDNILPAHNWYYKVLPGIITISYNVVQNFICDNSEHTAVP